MKQLRICLILAGFIAALFLGSSAVAQTSPDRLALKGYDPVAYFTEQRPMVGNAQYQHELTVLGQQIQGREQAQKILELKVAELAAELAVKNEWLTKLRPESRTA